MGSSPVEGEIYVGELSSINNQESQVASIDLERLDIEQLGPNTISPQGR